MACPFDLCTAVAVPVIEQAAPGDDETTLQRIPLHDIEGEYSRFGSCPASLLKWPLDEHGEVTLAVQSEMLRRIVREAQERKPITSATDKGRHEHSKTPHPRSSSTFGTVDEGPAKTQEEVDRILARVAAEMRRAAGGAPRVPMGIRGPRTDESTNPEPIGEGPQPQGESSNMSDDMRAQYRALTEQAIQTAAEAQDLGASLTDQIERETEARLVELRERVTAAKNLMLAAVGGGNDIPHAAAMMIANGQKAAQEIDDADAALALVLVRLAAAHAALNEAVDNGQQYLGTI